MELQESGEMYLETIYVLSRKGPFVRSVDVAEYMGFSRASVSRGVGILRRGGYLNVNEDGYLTLTEQGTELARRLYDRHMVVQDMLMRLGVDEKTAAEDACRVEHVISDTSFQAIRLHAEQFEP